MKGLSNTSKYNFNGEGLNMYFQRLGLNEYICDHIEITR